MEEWTFWQMHMHPSHPHPFLREWWYSWVVDYTYISGSQRLKMQLHISNQSDWIFKVLIFYNSLATGKKSSTTRQRQVGDSIVGCHETTQVLNREPRIRDCRESADLQTHDELDA